MHHKIVYSIHLSTLLVCTVGAVSSPDGRLTALMDILPGGHLQYEIYLDGLVVLPASKLGLVRNDEDFSEKLVLLDQSPVEKVFDTYDLPTSKRFHNTYEANQQIFHLETKTGRNLDIIFQVSNDGVAFRYRFPEYSTETYTLIDEITSFKFHPDTKAWLQPMSVAKTGWAQTSPAYEEYYEQEIAVGTPSPSEAGWVFPALFRSGDTWLAVSEGSLSRGNCASRLRSNSPNGEYTIGTPDPREVFTDGMANSFSTLPWTLPWRFVAIGSLKTVAESTLGTDLAAPAKYAAPDFPAGKAAWSWPLLGNSNTTYDLQKRFVDYAADMNWRYCLIDTLWDVQIGYEKVKELVDYAKEKNVGILLWYNSSGMWNDSLYTPRHMLLTHEKRIAEFTRLKEMGVAGLKIDFFAGDGSSMINYYLDILEDAQPFGLLINFHGCTLPRGWQRTYPNLMAMEAVRGLEFVTFNQTNADHEPTHAAVLPFTRNLFDPMDFTPMVLDRISDQITRRTTPAFELALSVLFTSGIQHYAEIPEGMAKMPDYVKTFLRHVPSVWTDVKFIDGYPGKFAIFARQGDGRWFVAGINAENNKKDMELDLGYLNSKTGMLITDGTDAGFNSCQVALTSDGKFPITLPPRGGFVLVLD